MGVVTLFLLLAQQPSFDVASVKASEQTAGPDYNNRIAYEPNGVRARNATLRRLIAEAYGLQLNQIAGPVWMDRNEYDLDARSAGPASARMLQPLLAERFGLKLHRETRAMRVFELTVDKGGPKIRPLDAGMTAQRFADFLAVQLTIVTTDDPTKPGRATEAPAPVLDKTGLTGTWDFKANIRPEAGSDSFVIWQEALREQLGLKLLSRREPVEVLVVDSAERTPTGN